MSDTAGFWFAVGLAVAVYGAFAAVVWWEDRRGRHE
jgi:hypothetical protein